MGVRNDIFEGSLRDSPYDFEKRNLGAENYAHTNHLSFGFTSALLLIKKATTLECPSAEAWQNRCTSFLV
jgi:hypothetical protein